MHLVKSIKTIKCVPDDFPGITLKCAIVGLSSLQKAHQMISGQQHNLQLLLPLLLAKHFKEIH